MIDGMQPPEDRDDVRDEDLDDALHPVVDPSLSDYPQVIAYVTNELTLADRAVVEQRRATDPTFAALLTGVRTIWQTPLPVPQRDVDAGWAAIQRKAAALQLSALASDSVLDATSARPPQMTRLPATHAGKVRRWRSARTWLTLAAVLFLGVFGLEVVRHQLYPAYYYQSGAVATNVTLPDGSQVQLAPGSYLGTAHGFPTRSRTVYLFGRAHFTVAHTTTHPFVVTVPGVSTRVLGTAFALDADTTPTVRITVTQGRVALETADSTGHWHAMQVLTAGEAVQVSRMEAWLGQAGYAIGSAGVPFREAMRFGVALRRAVIQMGANAASQRPGEQQPPH